MSAPQACAFDFTRLLYNNTLAPITSPATNGDCLTPAQVGTVKKVYGDYVSPSGQFLHLGLAFSTEEQWWLLLGGTTEPSPFGLAGQRDVLFDDPDWDWRMYNGSVITAADAHEPGRRRRPTLAP